MPHDRLIRRLVLAAVVLVALAAGAVAATVAWRVDDVVRPEVSARLEGIGRTIAGQIGLALDYGIPFAAIPRMEEFLTSMIADVPEIASVGVLGADGAALYGVGDEASGASVTVPVMRDGVSAGAVVLGLAPDPETAGRGVLGLRLAGLAVLAAALAGAVAGGLAWLWVCRPLRRLHDSLQRMAAGDFAVEPPEDAPSAIGAVARAAERLRASVERRHADFRVEIEEIALAQPDAQRRADIEALAEPVQGLGEAR